MVQTTNTFGRHVRAFAGAMSLCLIGSTPVLADDNPALKILHSMSDYVDSQATT